MRNVVIGIVVLLAIGALAFFALGQGGGEDTEGLSDGDVPAAETLPAIEASDRVVAEAEVVPIRDVELRFEVDGTINEVLVDEGDRVDRDAALMRIDTRDMELDVEEAKAELARARADFELLLEGATPDEVDAARARIAQAEASLQEAEAAVDRNAANLSRTEAEAARAAAELQRTQGAVTQEDIRAAEAQVAQRREELAWLESLPEAVDVETAQATVDQAQARLQNTRDSLSAAKTRAEADVELAANELRDAQAVYNDVYWEVREIERELNDVDQELWQEQKDREESALRDVQDAEQRLEQARIEFEEAKLAEVTGIQEAEANLREARARLEDVLEGPDPDDIAAARANLAEAEARLAELGGSGRQGEIASAAAGVSSAQANISSTAADISAAEAQVNLREAQLEQEQANLEDLVAAPRQPEIDDREAAILQAEVRLREQERTLEKATLRAPFAGTVVETYLERGERVERNQVAVLMADFSEWEIVTTDLTELGIVRVDIGSPVFITFDALPGLELEGEVKSIQDIGKNEQGDIVYEVRITPLEWDERLRWGMTATVEIEPID